LSRDSVIVFLSIGYNHSRFTGKAGENPALSRNGVDQTKIIALVSVRLPVELSHTSRQGNWE
jgi:hypothetical protein